MAYSLGKVPKHQLPGPCLVISYEKNICVCKLGCSIVGIGLGVKGVMREPDLDKVAILCLTSRTTVTSAHIPVEDACYRACNLCVFSHVQKGTPGIRD